MQVFPDILARLENQMALNVESRQIEIPALFGLSKALTQLDDVAKHPRRISSILLNLGIGSMNCNDFDFSLEGAQCRRGRLAAPIRSFA